MAEHIGYRLEIDFSEMVNKIAEQLNRRIDEAAVEQVEDRLVELGYVKVVRCRDCKYSIHFFHRDDERWQCAEPHQEGDDVKPDAYCWRGERKKGSDD